MSFKDVKNLVSLYESFDKTFEYDWENPYIDDVDNIKRHYGRVDKESGREDSSKVYTNRADADIREQEALSEKRAEDGKIESILDMLPEIAELVVEWEQNYLMDDEFEELSDESFEDLEYVVSELSKIDDAIKNLSEKTRSKLYDRFMNLTHNRDMHSDEEPSDLGYDIRSIYNSKDFIKYYTQVYNPEYKSELMWFIDDVCYHIDEDKKNQREYEEESERQWSAYVRYRKLLNDIRSDLNPPAPNPPAPKPVNYVDKLKLTAKELGIQLPSNLDKKNIKHLHRKIVSQLHPDKVPPEKKQEAHKKFVNYMNDVWDKIPSNLKESSDVFYMLYQKIILG